jgi:hypothetical protein
MSEFEQAYAFGWARDSTRIDIEGLSNIPIAIAALSPSEVYGVEVYTGASQLPAEFNQNGACGAFVVWTKRGRFNGLEERPARKDTAPTIGAAPDRSPRQ